LIISKKNEYMRHFIEPRKIVLS